MYTNSGDEKLKCHADLMNITWAVYLYVLLEYKTTGMSLMFLKVHTSGRC